MLIVSSISNKAFVLNLLSVLYQVNNIFESDIKCKMKNLSVRHESNIGKPSKYKMQNIYPEFNGQSNKCNKETSNCQIDAELLEQTVKEMK